MKISKYINFDYVSKWLIIYDSSKIKENPLLFKTNNKVIELLYNETESISGNAQRNHGLDLIENEEEESYIYFLAFHCIVILYIPFEILYLLYSHHK